MIELYTWGTPNGQKANIMVEEVGAEYVVKPIDIGKGDQKTSEFLAINPNGRIPAIVDEVDGKRVRVFESGAILVYLAEKFGKLLPTTPAERAEVLGWTFWQIGGLGPMIGQWGFFSRQEEKNEGALERYFDESVRLFDVLDERLKGREYLASEYSIADIACYPWAKGGLSYMGKAHPELAQRFPAVNAWIARIDPRPAVQKGMSIPAK